MYCDKATEKPGGGLEFETRGWIPSSLVLQEIAATVKEEVSKSNLKLSQLFCFVLEHKDYEHWR